MKKLFDAKPILFAVLWIIAYVVLFGSAAGVTDNAVTGNLIQCGVGIILLAVLLLFTKKHDLWAYFGLCRLQGSWKVFLFLIPGFAAFTWKLWLLPALPAFSAEFLTETLALGIIAPVLEELILRSMLFRAIARKNVRNAFWITALAFGVGHLVNLARGADPVETLVQVAFAVCVGICLGAILWCGKTLWPCILMHIMNNTLVSQEESSTAQLICIGIACAMMLAYGLYLLWAHRESAPLSPAPYPEEEA